MRGARTPLPLPPVDKREAVMGALGAAAAAPAAGRCARPTGCWAAGAAVQRNAARCDGLGRREHALRLERVCWERAGEGVREAEQVKGERRV